MTLNGEVLNLLKRIGLNQYESKVYSALLSKGNSTAGEISDASNVPRSRVYDVLVSLQKKGYITTQVGRPVKYTSVSPESIITQIKLNYEQEYRKQIESFNKFEGSLLSGLKKLNKGLGTTTSESNIVTVIKGRSNIYNHMCKLINNSKNRIVKATTPDGLEHFVKHCHSALESAKKRGVKIKIAAGIPDVKKLPENSKKIHAISKIRHIKNLNARFFIKDGIEAVMLLSPEDTGILVKSPYMASYLENLFEHAWEKGEVVSF